MAPLMTHLGTCIMASGFLCTKNVYHEADDSELPILHLDLHPLRSSTPISQEDTLDTESSGHTEIYHMQEEHSNSSVSDGDCEVKYNKWPSTDYSESDSCLSDLSIYTDLFPRDTFTEKLKRKCIVLSFVIMCLAFRATWPL